MPVSRRFDFQLGGKGFMLQRGQFRGRAWTRTGRSDTPGQRSAEDARYGVLPDELDHPEVWNDWSGGAFHPYRRPGQENTYHWAENFDPRFPRQLVHCQRFLGVWASGNLPQSVPQFLTTGDVDTGEVNTGRGAVMAPDLFKAHLLDVVPNASGYWATTGVSLPDRCVGQAVLFGSYYYVPVMSANVRKIPLTCGTQLDANFFAWDLVVAGGRLNKISPLQTGSRPGAYYQSCAAGNDAASLGNWTATIVVGDGISQPMGMVALDDQVFVRMPDGLYAGDLSGTFVNVMQQLQTQRDARSYQMAVHQERVYVPDGANIWEYGLSGLQGDLRQVGPRLGQRSYLRGRLSAVRGYGQFLYAGLATSTANWLLAGHDTGSDWAWHTLNRIRGATTDPVPVLAIHFDSISVGSANQAVPPRCWLSIGRLIGPPPNTSPYIFGQAIPPGHQNPLGEIDGFSANYIGSARIDLGEVDWGAPGTPKLFRSCEVWAENLASGAQWCDVYYTVDGGTRTKLGTVAQSPKDTLYFPTMLDTGAGLPPGLLGKMVASAVTGQNIALSVESFTASAGVTPIYRTFILRGALQPRNVDMIQAVVRIADGMRDRQGNQMPSGAAMLEDLRNFGNPDFMAGHHLQLIDLAGATCWVKVLGRVDEQEVYQQGEDNPEIAATVRMAVLTFS